MLSGSALTTDLLFFAIATLVSAAGIGALAVAALRSREPLLVWLGALATMYGLRLFLQNDLFRAATGISDQTLTAGRLLLTYVLPIPFALFARELLGPGWKRLITAWCWLEAAFAAVAIPVALITRNTRQIDRVNGFLVITGTVLLLAQILSLRDERALARPLTGPLLVFGVLVVLTNRGFRPFGVDAEPFGFLVLLGGLGFIAVQRTAAHERKLTEVEQELATARRIQNTILPAAPPAVRGLRVAARYEPMTAVAGDFYDFLNNGEEGITVLVADVSGHGVPAALIASMLKVGFAAQRDHAHDPARILTELNRMLRDGLGGQYVTAGCAALDLGARTLKYAGAGHPPALLLRGRQGEVARLEENGLFLGPFPHAKYENMEVGIGSGDRLMLYTDGISEATCDGGAELGIEGVAELLLETGQAPLARALERVLQRIATSAPQDDRTLVMLELA